MALFMESMLLYSRITLTMPRAPFSFVGDIASLREALTPTLERQVEQQEDEEIVLFLEDLAGDASYVPSCLEAQLA
jgi:hypothetical protein